MVMNAICISEMSVYFYETAQRYSPEDRHLHTCCHENLKSHKKTGYKFTILQKKGKNIARLTAEKRTTEEQRLAGGLSVTGTKLWVVR
jgi:hypothetical protein